MLPSLASICWSIFAGSVQVWCAATLPDTASSSYCRPSDLQDNSSSSPCYYEDFIKGWTDLAQIERCLKLTYQYPAVTQGDFFLIKETLVGSVAQGTTFMANVPSGYVTAWILKIKPDVVRSVCVKLLSHQHLLSLLDSLQCSPWAPVPSCIQFILFRFCSGEVYIEVNKIALATGVGSPLPAEYRPWSESAASAAHEQIDS